MKFDPYLKVEHYQYKYEILKFISCKYLLSGICYILYLLTEGVIIAE